MAKFVSIFCITASELFEHNAMTASQQKLVRTEFSRLRDCFALKLISVYDSQMIRCSYWTILMS